MTKFGEKILQTFKSYVLDWAKPNDINAPLIIVKMSKIERTS